MTIKQVKQGKHYSVERHSGYNHRTTEQVEWVVRSNASNLIVAVMKTKKEALEWVNIS